MGINITHIYRTIKPSTGHLMSSRAEDCTDIVQLPSNVQLRRDMRSAHVSLTSFPQSPNLAIMISSAFVTFW